MSNIRRWGHALALAGAAALAAGAAVPASADSDIADSEIEDVGTLLSEAYADLSQWWADQAHSQSQVESIVILGDSYASGNGAGDYTDSFCLRSANAPGEIVGRELGAHVTNVACNGAWISHLTRPHRAAVTPWQPVSVTVPEGTPAQSDHPDFIQPASATAQALCSEPAIESTLADVPDTEPLIEFRSVEVAGTAATAEARCAAALPPQLDAIEDTDAIIITMGGNDMGFIPVVLACFVVHSEADCIESVAESRALFDATMATYADALVQVRAAAPTADLYLVGYPRFLAPDHYRVGDYDAGADVNAFQEEWQNRLEGIGENLSGDGHPGEVVVVDLSAWDGHGVNPRFGANNSQSWIHSPWSFDSQIVERFHPTARGAEETANALLNYLEVE